MHDTTALVRPATPDYTPADNPPPQTTPTTKIIKRFIRDILVARDETNRGNKGGIIAQPRKLGNPGCLREETRNVPRQLISGLSQFRIAQTRLRKHFSADFADFRRFFREHYPRMAPRNLPIFRVFRGYLLPLFRDLRVFRGSLLSWVVASPR